MPENIGWHSHRLPYEMGISKHLIARIKLNRRRACRIAHQAGLAPSTFSRIVNGIDRVKSGDLRIARLAAVLGLPEAECYESDANPLVQTLHSISLHHILTLKKSFEARQTIFQLTGSTHSASGKSAGICRSYNPANSLAAKLYMFILTYLIHSKNILKSTASTHAFMRSFECLARDIERAERLAGFFLHYYVMCLWETGGCCISPRCWVLFERGFVP